MSEERDPIQQKIDRWRKKRVTKELLGNTFIPNTYNNGLTIENIFRDAAPGIADVSDWAEGKEVPPEQLAWDMLLSFPGLAAAGTAGKKIVQNAAKKGIGKSGFVQAVFLPKQGNKAILVKPKTNEELKKFNLAIDEAVKKGQIPANDAQKIKFNALSDLYEQKTLEKAIRDGVINPDITPTSIDVLKEENVSPHMLEKFNLAKQVGQNNKVIEKPFGISKRGNKYYTKGEKGNQLLFSENNVDAQTARHIFTDYDEKLKKASPELVEKYPNPKDPRRFGYIFDKEGNARNPYKAVVEPEMLRGRLPYNSEAAAMKSINQGAHDLLYDPRYMESDDFLKYILGL